MSLARSFLRQRKKNFGWKERRNKVFFEPLEPRLLLSSDLSCPMTEAANVLTLRLKDVNGVDTLQLINNEDPSPDTQIVASQALADTSAVKISGSERDDRLMVDFSNPFSLPITFADTSAADSDTLEVIGGDNTWDVTGSDGGNVGDLNFSGIENLAGGPNNRDTFIFEPGGSLSGLVEGGEGGFDSLVVHTSIHGTKMGVKLGDTFELI
jgi:hypothetical protein